MGEEGKGGWQITFARIEMMLCEPGGLEAQLLSVDDLLRRQTIALARTHII
jgi:hypothetical protein